MDRRVDHPAQPVPRTLLALIEAPGHVCFRYRLEAFAGPLAAAGWKLDELVLRRSTLPDWTELGRIAAADAVVLQRWLYPAWRLALLRRAASCLVFDLDDAIFYRDSNHRRGAQSLRRMGRFRATVRAADAVLAGNAFLAEQAAAVDGPGKVHDLPTCVDPTLYPTAAHRRAPGQLKLAWIGSRSTAISLLEAQAGLRRAAQRVPGLVFRLVCDWFPDLGPDIAVEHCLWNAACEASDLAEADAGVSWLPDHPWSRGKCGLKVLQYMAAGLPVVANPIGVHRDMIEHGRTGFLAETPDEWAAAIERLAASPALRAEMGRAARQFVADHYSVQRWAGLLPRLLEELTGARGRVSSPRRRQTRASPSSWARALREIAGGVRIPGRRPTRPCR